MDPRFVLPRVHVHSFAGGRYNIDMEESLGLRVPLSEAEQVFPNAVLPRAKIHGFTSSAQYKKNRPLLTTN